jgi:hypothetical protein
VNDLEHLLLRERDRADVAEAALTFLRREIDAVLESIPQSARVRAHEGGGRENIAASLAVSVEKLIRAKQEAERKRDAMAKEANTMLREEKAASGERERAARAVLFDKYGLPQHLVGDGTGSCFHDQASGPRCANDAHYPGLAVKLEELLPDTMADGKAEETIAFLRADVVRWRREALSHREALDTISITSSDDATRIREYAKTRLAAGLETK